MGIKKIISKTVFCGGIFFILAIILTGCGQNNNIEPARKDFRVPDFGQPDRPADISGLVESILGNEVKVLAINHPIISADGEGTEKQNKEAPAVAIGTQPMGGGPGMMGGRRPEESDDNDREAMLEKIKEMSSGEEIIVIPVGIQMLKPAADNNQGAPEMVEATLEDISADKMIQIWLDDAAATDKKVASFVLITN